MYSIDTSSVIAAWVEHYPKDRFPSVWTHVDGLAKTGRLLVSQFVLEELERQDDGAAEWCKGSGIVVPVDEGVQVAVSRILAQHPNLVDVRKSRSMADPWVIALAQSRSGTVVTQENRSTSPSTMRVRLTALGPAETIARSHDPGDPLVA